MKGRGDRGPPTDPVRNRCKCGHFPTTHVQVALITGKDGSGYRLDPTGPCATCRDSICPRFTPAV
ncbi:MAG: hypothetical protein L3K06_05495 [Thermoplasmata archaeon]|nr:hypothetical protein [Thermoplasmata archaeon]MCI4354803.1 hypothetical protein [Thermoplasmata archaeon]